MAGIVRNASGVTLIELLVVVAIMMTVLSLVGGTTLRSVNKVKGQTELISLLNIMKQASAKAFSSSTEIIVQLSGNAVSIQNPSSPSTSRTFKHLSFEKRQIVFNRNGFADISRFSVLLDGERKEIDLSDLINISVSSFYQDEVSFEK